MRKSNPMVLRLMLWTGVVAVMYALDTEGALRELAETVPNLGIPATALGFTLITSANRDRK
jgi:hypothetical protein